MVRYAKSEDITRINEIVNEVNELHVKGRPDIFKSGLGDAMIGYLTDLLTAKDKSLFVSADGEDILGFAAVSYYTIPESPFSCCRNYCEITEFGIASKYQHRGVSSELMKFIQDEAAKRDIRRIELNVWEFNEDAIAFYEKMGFKSFRRHMELENR